MTGGFALGLDQLQTAARESFVEGSIVAETLAPYYQVNDLNLEPAALDRTLASDAVTLNEMIGAIVFNYGPPMRQLGYTDHYHNVREVDPTHVADDHVRRAATIVVGRDVSLYRVRLNVEAGPGIVEPLTFDPSSLALKNQAGRWDDFTSSVLYISLYISDDIELCLHECRTTLGDEIFLATLCPTRELQPIDVSRGFGRDSMTAGSLLTSCRAAGTTNSWRSAVRSELRR